MHTRSSSNLPVVSPPNLSTSNPKCRNRRRSKQPFILEESPIDTMADQCTMAELLRATTEGYAEAIVVPSILVEQFELKHSLINMMISDQFFGLEKDNPHDHIHWFKKITSTIKYKDMPNSIQRPLRACPHHGFTELHQLDTFYNVLNPADQDSFNAVAGGNLLERRTQDVLTIIKNKSKCLAIDGNTFPELRDNIQGYVLVAAVNYNPGSGSLPSNTVAIPKGELKAITTRSGLVLDRPTIPTPPPFINPEVDEHVKETLTDPNLFEYTIKVPPPPVQKYKPPSQRDYVVHQRDLLHPNIPYSSRMLKQKQQEKDEFQIYKFWKMFKQLHINITLADTLILMPKYQKMLKALLSNKEKLQELVNTPLNENCSAIILKKLPKKLGDPGKFHILCGFSELKCKALADLGASINLMPLSIWKKLDLPELISTRMTLKLANRAICTPAGIARDVFVLELADELALITFPLKYDDDLQFDVEFDLKEIEFLLHQNIDSSLKDSIDQKSKLLIDELDLPCDFLPLSEYDSFTSEDFSRVNAKPSTNNEDKVNDTKEKDKIRAKTGQNQTASGKRRKVQSQA
nr:reverse transcriptase domain-containing protein [Tanacetum cinerariifolium]